MLGVYSSGEDWVGDSFLPLRTLPVFVLPQSVSSPSSLWTCGARLCGHWHSAPRLQQSSPWLPGDLSAETKVEVEF